jgi:hypothetical protein
MGTGSMVLFGLFEHRMAFQESAVASTRVWAHRLWDPIAFGTPSPLGPHRLWDLGQWSHLFRIFFAFMWEAVEVLTYQRSVF